VANARTVPSQVLRGNLLLSESWRATDQGGAATAVAIFCHGGGIVAAHGVSHFSVTDRLLYPPAAVVSRRP